MVAKKTAAKKSTADARKAAADKPGPAAKKRASAATAMSAEAVPHTPEEEPEHPPAAGRTAKKTPGGKGAGRKKAVRREAGEAPADGGPAPRKAAAKKAAKKTAPAEKAVPAKKTGAKTVVEKQTPGGAPAAEAEQDGTGGAVPKARAAAPGELAVRPGEDPWTPAEVAEARTELHDEVARLRTEIQASEDALAGLMRDTGEGTGDEADTGSKNITREHEMALASNAREMLLQTERALERLDAGTYGLCENCGKPIGKARMQAFPRATLCVECKQRQERR
ncbi:TraR/DksA family transcriptional regulator [Streptomyces chrestomyceticus]|uniref:TraR/DksA family transcriptional regulator n=1 Tax=Streptomyces chrestomyceticus TaxID=68185 RepID=UPI0019D1F099|nr:TraR/DksA C4-type zinc finger protein [Streptomyces chrestomyceticus]